MRFLRAIRLSNQIARILSLSVCTFGGAVKRLFLVFFLQSDGKITFGDGVGLREDGLFCAKNLLFSARIFV